MTQHGSDYLTTWGRLVRDVGFPIVVAVFLLWQLPPLRDALIGLQETLRAVQGALQEQTRELREHRDRSEHPTSRGASQSTAPRATGTAIVVV